jgi:protein SCO1/2
MNIRILVAIFVAAVLGASEGAAEERHAMRGVVLSVDAAAKTMVVSTEKVPGFMDAMAMPFAVRTATALKGITPGTSIEFVYIVDGRTSRAEDIHIKAYENLEREPLELRRLKLLSQLAAGRPITPLAVGEAVPDFTLTDQYGQSVTFSSLTGKAVAVTFAYMRCPNPAYCFRLASNFSQLQKRFAKSLSKDLALLTIVIDPEHDQGHELVEYARIWTSNPAWHFLTGPVDQVKQVAGRLGVDFWQDEGLLVHSFGTAVIDRRGVVAVRLEGNQFTAKQLGDLVQQVIDRK